MFTRISSGIAYRPREFLPRRIKFNRHQKRNLACRQVEFLCQGSRFVRPQSPCREKPVRGSASGKRVWVETNLTIEILPQPDGLTCGPTCLHSLYRYYGDEIPLARLIAEVPRLDHGGTLDVLLANHALRRGYDASIFTYNLQLFDPTWFYDKGVDLASKLKEQARHKSSAVLATATEAYVEFLSLGGKVRFEDLNSSLIRRYLNRGTPLLTGLSATYLHRSAREDEVTMQEDDVRGLPAGHFVILCGYDREERLVMVADPLESNPVSGSNYYLVSLDRVICAILLGIITYDANLLIIEPRKSRKPPRNAHTHRRE